MKRFFLKDEIMRNNKRLRTFRTACRAYWTNAREFLSLFDIIRLCRYLAKLNERTERKTKSKHAQLIMILRRKRFGTALIDGKKHDQSLLDYVLSDTEELVLEDGLNFCLPPKTVCYEQLFAEFESLWAQLHDHNACSIDTQNPLKARLIDLQHSYGDNQIEKHDFLIQSECYQARRQDSVTGVGAEINCGGAQEIYSSVDQTNKVKTKQKDLQFKIFHKFGLSSQNFCDFSPTLK